MSLSTLFSHVGVMRFILLSCTLICFPLVSLADVEPIGLGILTAYVVPPVVVILFFVLLLDALMNRVFMVDLSGEKRAVRRLRVGLNLAAVAGILIFWGPYYQQIGSL